MQYAVLRNYNRHIVLRIQQTAKVTQFIEAQAVGIVLSKLSTPAFNKEFDTEVPSAVSDAAVSFLKLAQRAYMHNLPVIQKLKEIIMATATTAEAKTLAAKASEAPTPSQQEVADKKAEKAAKAKAAKPPTEAKPRGLGIGAFCVALIKESKSNDEILTAVRAKWPDAKTTTASLNWYRADIKRGAK
jgi:hypothetical protein